LVSRSRLVDVTNYDTNNNANNNNNTNDINFNNNDTNNDYHQSTEDDNDNDDNVVEVEDKERVDESEGGVEVRRSSRSRTAPDRLSYEKLGGIAAECLQLAELAVRWSVQLAQEQCLGLRYEVIEKPKTILAAYYAKFQRLNYDNYSNTIKDESPLSLMIRANEKDNLTWAEAQVTNEYDLFRAAALEEIQSLSDKKSWKIMKRPLVKGNILPSTWALKRNRYPDGRIRKYKAPFCVQGDKQKFGFDYDDTYAPVVQWSTVHMLLTLTMKLGLKTKQVDYLNTFVQAKIDGEVYCELPEEFSVNSAGRLEYVLKLERSLYGLKQAARLWFKTLEKSLHDRGFKTSAQDLCMFMKKKLIVLVYVNDVLFFGMTEKIIGDMIEDLQKDFDLNVEDSMFAFLGIEMFKDKKGKLCLRQKGLIDQIIAAVGMDKNTN